MDMQRGADAYAAVERSRVLRDAVLRTAPQDEADFCAASMVEAKKNALLLS
jgi:hypothetical protein